MDLGDVCGAELTHRERNRMTEDYGFDPAGPGQWKLHPSGRIVNKEGLEEFKRTRVTRMTHVRNDILGMSWTELENKQGGKLRFADGDLKPRK